MKKIVEKIFSEATESSTLNGALNPSRFISNASSEFEYDEDLPEEMAPDYVRPRAVIRAAEEEIFDRVWFSRNTRFVRNDTGESVLVPLIPESAPAIRELLEKYGSVQALLPADEFESGILNGKVSALRWVLGAEWDFLDT